MRSTRQNNSLVDGIVKDLHRQIWDAKLRPGERLPSERSLCSLFGVSRTTVREALKALAVEGFVTRSSRGAVVTDSESHPPVAIDLAALAAQASIKDLYDVRKLLEVRMARWAALRATPEDIERLRRTVESGRTGSSGNPNTAFHTALVTAAHNPVMAQVYHASRRLFFRLPAYWKLFDEREVQAARAWRHDLARRWHRYILAAIERHDPEEVAGAMFQHLDLMEKDLLTRLHAKGGTLDGALHHAHPLLTTVQSADEDELQPLPVLQE